MSGIRRAEKKDLSRIIEIHQRSFPGFFLTKLGKSFLHEYYKTYFDVQHLMLVAVDRDAQVVGFVSGTSDSKLLYTTFKKKFYRFLLPTVTAMFKPTLWSAVLQKSISVIRTDSVNSQFVKPEKYCELTSLAVDPSYRGKALGSCLIEEFSKIMSKEHDVRGILLTTDVVDNDGVINFYIRNGYDVYAHFVQGKAREMFALVKRFDVII